MIYYVDINAGREGNGSREMPFRRINDAAKVAMPGDEVLVAPGVYREEVAPPRGGTDDAHRITYRSETEGAAVITGAEVLDDDAAYVAGATASRNDFEADGRACCFVATTLSTGYRNPLSAVKPPQE